MWSFVLALLTPAFAGTLTFAPDAESATEVRWSDAGANVVLEKFAAAEGVIGSEVSGDGKFAFAWHQPKGKSLRVSVYDLQAKQRISSFSPGYGGTLVFSAANTLVLTRGCGTSCHVLTVFDLNGKTLLDVGGTFNEVSPSRRYALIYSGFYSEPGFGSEPGPSSLIDLATGAVIVQSSVTESGEVGVDAVKWGVGDATVVLTIVAREGGTAPPRYLRLAPDGTAAWVASP
jgi:hypothetical protein